jgi:hypothetical protein
MRRSIAICSSCHMGLLESVDEKDNPVYYCSTCDKTTVREKRPSLFQKIKKLIFISTGALLPFIIGGTILVSIVASIKGCNDDLDKPKTFIVVLDQDYSFKEQKDYLIEVTKRKALMKGVPFKLIDYMTGKYTFVVRTTYSAMPTTISGDRSSVYTFREVNALDEYKKE